MKTLEELWQEMQLKAREIEEAKEDLFHQQRKVAKLEAEQEELKLAADKLVVARATNKEPGKG